MSKPSQRRKKARPGRKRYVSFRIAVEAQEMVVSYRPNRFGGMGQFEFRSPHKPPRRIPVSETGYLSHFASMEEVKAAKSPKDFARDEALALLRSRRRVRDEANELPLF